MAATTFKNVSSVTVGGVAISEPLTLTLEHDGAPIADKVEGGSFPTAIGTGAKVRRITVTSRDPITCLSARGATGACDFSLDQGCDAAGTRSYDLGSGTGGNFSFESGEPGELGTSTIEAILTGDTFTPS